MKRSHLNRRLLLCVLLLAVIPGAFARQPILLRAVVTYDTPPVQEIRGYPQVVLNDLPFDVYSTSDTLSVLFIGPDTLHVEVRHPGYATWFTDVVAPPAGEKGFSDLLLHPSLVKGIPTRPIDPWLSNAYRDTRGTSRYITGTVVDSVTRQPLDSVVAAMSYYNGDSRSLSDEQGRFAIPLFSDRETTFHIGKPGYLARSVKLPDVIVDSVDFDRVIALQPDTMFAGPGTGTILGRVVVDIEKEAIPVKGAEVQVLGQDRITTDAEGRFAFPGVPFGKYRIAVVHPGYGSWSDEIELQDHPGLYRRTLDVHLTGRGTESGALIRLSDLLQDSAMIQGRVLDRGTGEPLENVRVDVEGSPRAALTGPDGYFALRGLPENQVRLRFSRAHYLWLTRRALASISGSTIEVRLEPADEVERDTLESPTLTLSGRVTDVDQGRWGVMRGGEVSLKGTGCRAIVTRENGFTLHEVPEGVFAFHFRKDGHDYEVVEPDSVRLPAAVEAYTELKVRNPRHRATLAQAREEAKAWASDRGNASGVLHGSVFITVSHYDIERNESSNLSGVKVTLLDSKRSTETDEGGLAVFFDLPAGDYRVIFDKVGYATKSTLFEVEPGEEEHFGISLHMLGEKGFDDVLPTPTEWDRE